MFITFDLDAKADLGPKLEAMGFAEKKDFLALGQNMPGKRDIEGLLPDSIKTAVRAAHPGLVDQATSTNKDESRSAKNQLKKLYLEEFCSKAEYNDSFFGAFYEVTKQINRAMA